ncbi:hypothetical protein AB6V29_15315 [Microbacterium sp. 20-116]|uniref:hypothetical protein n=1 Tax=unclassified Microbacterium TaxID=2609290 RepID=UPI002270DD35|nr:MULTISPECIES: hypothetical protein [unclassified Microbacterium]MDQ1175893.1 hypothetical protein [Microbacterium sp. SORGH_AS_0421]WAC69839.1 hypothetical protein OVA17_03890 [Microbacterium sp. SL75]
MSPTSRRGLTARIGVAALGVGILAAAGGGSAFAADEDTVDVQVEIAPAAEPGVLALTVADDATTLTEGEASGTDRTFTGTLPTVTVTDTRLPENVDPEAYWYVMGAISDFAGDAGQPAISSADSFGWYPTIVAGDSALVAPGDPVDPGIGGFVDAELLANADNSAAAAGGAYSASAGLVLQTPATVAPGAYSATITLTLLEG